MICDVCKWLGPKSSTNFLYLGNVNGIEDEETIEKLVNGLILPVKFHSIGYPVLITTSLVIFLILVFCSIRDYRIAFGGFGQPDRHHLKILVPQTDWILEPERWILELLYFPSKIDENVSQITIKIIINVKPKSWMKQMISFHMEIL